MLKRMIAIFAVLLIMASVTACGKSIPDTVEQPALATEAAADQIEALIVSHINEYTISALAFSIWYEDAKTANYK